MAIMQDEDTRFRHLEKKIGVFVLVALLGIVIAVVSVGVQQELFATKSSIFFISDSGQDITKRTAVKLSGFNIGAVHDLALTNSAKVKVTLSIKSEYMKWIRKDARARLTKEGMIGDTIIEIIPGDEQAPPLGKNQPIAFERERGLGAVVDELYGEVVPLIEDVRKLARSLDQATTDFRSMLHGTNQVIANLPATVKTFDALLLSAEKNLKNLEDVTGNALPAMMRDGNRVIADSQKMVDSLNQTWPISRYVESPESQLLRVDSYDGAKPPAVKP